MKPRITLITLAVDDLERASLAADAGLQPGAPAQPGALAGAPVCLAHNVSSRDEVDAVMREAAAAGAVLVKRAEETFWGGYAGYFRDPDGHLWEVAWNPQMLPG